MTTLKQRMAENGFESNDSYDYVLRALTQHPDHTIPCISVQGDGGRRKTAFANAFANAIDEVNYIFYHDFTVEEEPTKPVYIKPEDDESEGQEAPPISALDKIMSDACAYSEADPTILILDQLQAADFKDHIRIYELLTSKEWHYNDATFYANRKNLMVLIISEEDVYHSLQKHSFRVWVNQVSDKAVPYKAADFGLHSDIQPVMNALADLFEKLHVTPTFSEYKKILRDVPVCVHTVDDLANTLFGWTEGLDYAQLKSKEVRSLMIDVVMPEIERYIGVEDIVEFGPLPDDLALND